MICAFNHIAKAQTIIIDSTFTSDAVIHPFGPNDTLYSLKISGSLILNSDTSLVRVIIGNEDSLEYMVYESYPMISSDYSFSFSNESDETTLLNEFSPEYLKVFIIDATISISNISDFVAYQEGLDSLQNTAKHIMDSIKIENINLYIQQNGMDWTAEHTNISNKFYIEKKCMLGSNYNLLGFDYYISGVYERLFDDYTTIENNDLVKEFSWIEKHDANLSSSAYYDQDHGWITPVQNQHSCGSCISFSCTALLEAMINLYFNKHIDADLSEAQVYNCNALCDCNSGGSFYSVLQFLNDGVINESCYVYEDPFCDPWIYPWNPPNCINYPGCTQVDFRIKPTDHFNLLSIYSEINDENIKKFIMDYGPCTIQVVNFFGVNSHAMLLVGFEYDEEDNSTIWVIKNSWGAPPPPNYELPADGYVRMKADLSNLSHFSTLQTPIVAEEVSISPNPFIIEKGDEDKDGYYNWGIGDMPSGWTPPYSQEPDWNDNNGRIGPRDDNYYGTPVRPIMTVDCSDEIIDDDGFFTFYETSQNRDFVFTITNEGGALLNLNPFELVTSSNNTFFEVIIDQYFTTSIGMEGGTTQFTVRYYYTPESSYDKSVITIHTLEPEYGDFKFIMANIDCNQLPGGDINITSSTTWDSQDIISGNVYVHNGAELTIEGTYGFIDGIDLNIKPGGRVIIDGGVLTNVCDNTWQGVDVWGDENLCQYPTSNQGFLNIINGGKIQNAEYGVQVANAISLTSYARGTTGGIIKCDSAVFINNKYDVIIYPYLNINPGTGEEVPNMCTFRNSFFITDFGYSESDKHVYLRGVDGVKFRGCTFENKTDFVDTPFNEKLDVGIYSHNSGFYVEDYCMNYSVPCNHSNRCLFNNLRYGVYALNSMSSKYICIDTAIFLNNLTGIYMSAVDEQRITSNDFLVDYFEDFSVAYELPNPVGLYLETCKYYMIEENSFSNESTIDNATGIHILNSGLYASEVYNNSFDGFYTGVTAAGENRNGTLEGLCLICNDFMRCETDIYITPEGGSTPGNLGINQQQGLPNGQAAGPAGNTFTDEEYFDVVLNFNNNTDNSINYAHHLNQEGKILEPEPITNTTINLQPDQVALYSKQQSCPSNLGGGINIQTEMLMLSAGSNQITAYEDTLSQLVDGGNTDDLNLEVQTSFPNEAMQLRQELLNESPYLSDTVMETAIMKENVLPNTMIRDVLVANPQSAKSAEVLNTLNDRFTPMPDYMMAEIMQGLNTIGAKEILEQELSKHKTIRSKSLSKLLQHYKQDTINAWAQDSLLSLLLSEPYPGPYYEAAFIYLEYNDSISMQNTLDNIPFEFILSDREIIVHNLFINYFNILNELQMDSLKAIDSTQELSLINIAQHDHLLPGIYARNHLLGNGLINYVEPVFLPESLKSTPAWQNAKPTSEENPKLMKVFPNPAGSYFIIEYDLRKIEGKAVVLMTDLSGKILGSYYLEDKQNQQLVGTDSYPRGMYFLQLFNDNELIEIHKVLIIK